MDSRSKFLLATLLSFSFMLSSVSCSCNAKETTGQPTTQSTAESTTEPTPTPVPTDTPTPKPTKSTKPTKAPTEPTEPKPTETTPKPTETTPKPTDPPPTDPPTPTPDTGGRDYNAEQQAGVQRAKELGYTITKVGDAKAEYCIYFKNATGTYFGTAYIMSSGHWAVSYSPVDTDDPNATYSFHKRGGDIVALLNSIDSAWMNYGS